MAEKQAYLVHFYKDSGNKEERKVYVFASNLKEAVEQISYYGTYAQATKAECVGECIMPMRGSY